MKTKSKKKIVILSLAALIAVVGAFLTLSNVTRVKSHDYAIKIKASELMNDMMKQIVVYKNGLGVALIPEDIHATGMLGERFTGITTTLGSLESKRTTANPDMAALVVEMFDKVGLSEGDTVGATFSGSFPAMNLAVISASDAMGINIVYISSVGSSTYGATNPELTFPDMVYKLANDGLIKSHSSAFTMGGGADAGIGIDQVLFREITDRLNSYDIPLFIDEDYTKNLAYRMDIYGEIDCFVGVGGNLASAGRNDEIMPTGIINPHDLTSKEGSGLIEIYSEQGIPVINYLDINKIVTDYGLPFDPVTLSPIGTSAIFYDDSYPITYGAVSVMLVMILLVYYKKL